MLVPSQKIEAAASRDQTRPVLTFVNVRTDPDGSQWLEATDSYKLARVPVTLEDGETVTDGLVPAGAIAGARKGRATTLTVGEDTVSYEGREGSVSMLRDRERGQFPDAAKFLPTNLHTFEIGLNAKFLLELATALGAVKGDQANVKVRFTMPSEFDRSAQLGDPSALRPMVVEPISGPGAGTGAIGILMPVRCPGK